MFCGFAVCLVLQFLNVGHHRLVIGQTFSVHELLTSEDFYGALAYPVGYLWWSRNRKKLESLPSAQRSVAYFLYGFFLAATFGSIARVLLILRASRST